MFKKIKMKILALKIEWHWMLIKRSRGKINKLINTGEPFKSKKSMNLDLNITKHGEKAMNAQQLYEELAGITAPGNIL